MQKNHRILYILPALILLIAGCVPAPPATPSPEEIAEQVATSVALTIQAQEDIAEAVAQTMEAQQPPVEPTETEEPEPLPTPTSLPTATSIVIVPTSGSGGGGGGAPVKPRYACDIIHQRPYDNTVFRPNDPFDVKWTIVNTGTDTWPTGYDLEYLSGPRMIQNPYTVELPEMKPGAQFVVPVFDALAPQDKGFHVETWKLEGGFCYPYVAIKVE